MLRRDELRRYFSIEEAEIILDFLQHGSRHVVCSAVASGLPDRGDLPFLETALTAAAPLVTGNKRHYPEVHRRSCRVFTPAEFIEEFSH